MSRLESPSAFSSRIVAPLLGQQVAEPAEDLAGLRRPRWGCRSSVGHVLGTARRRPRAAPRGACPASGWRRGGTRRSPYSSQPGPGRRQGAANLRIPPARVRTRRKKLPQTLWRKSSESNRDRSSRGNCRRTTSRTSASYRCSSSRAAPSSPAWIRCRKSGSSLSPPRILIADRHVTPPRLDQVRRLPGFISSLTISTGSRVVQRASTLSLTQNLLVAKAPCRPVACPIRHRRGPPRFRDSTLF